MYSLERIHSLQREGHPIAAGTAGENVTVEGIDWDLVIPGARLRLGDEVLLVERRKSGPASKISDNHRPIVKKMAKQFRQWDSKDLANFLRERGFADVSARTVQRVLKEMKIRKTTAIKDV